MRIFIPILITVINGAVILLEGIASSITSKQGHKGATHVLDAHVLIAFTNICGIWFMYL